MTLFDLPRTEEEAIAFLQEHGILPTERLCKKGHQMKLNIGAQTRWRCNKTGCRSEVNMRVGNWFQDTRLPFVTAIRFFYSWAYELTSIEWCERELQIGNNAAIDWNNYMREAVAEDLIRHRPDQKIGGPDKIVEIDESMFSKRKNNAGRVLPQQWIFGGICRETRQCFLVMVPDRSAATLLDAIKNYIADGSTIYSDSWRGYKTDELEKAGFEHFKVNHKLNFVNPETGVHTQTVERMWGSAKWRNKRHRGTARHHLESYLAEFMWRKMLKGDNVFDSLLEAIKDFWPPEIQL